MARTGRATAARKKAGGRRPVRRSRTVSRARTTRSPRPRATSRPAGEPSSGVAPGTQPITAYLAVRSVDASAAFLEQVLGLTRGVVLAGPDGAARYAEMRHGASTVVLVPAGDAATATGGAAGLYTYVDDVDRRVAAAADAGAVTTPAEDAAWGDRVAAIVDPDGYRWVLATFKKLAPFS
ncbi:MAG: VOC family protein [Vicinamibacterales bacterium]